MRMLNGLGRVMVAAACVAAPAAAEQVAVRTEEVCEPDLAAVAAAQQNPKPYVAPKVDEAALHPSRLPPIKPAERVKVVLVKCQGGKNQ